MSAAGATRLVYISSLSVLRPPRTSWERLGERTPLAPLEARHLGAYAWGKTEAERVVAAEAGPLRIQTRILRPAALVDCSNPEVPGFVGRHLFGRLHLGLGRPGLPFPACDVERAAAVVASCAVRFEAAPAAVNLSEPALRSLGRPPARSRGVRAHGRRPRAPALRVPRAPPPGARLRRRRDLLLPRGREPGAAPVAGPPGPDDPVRCGPHPVDGPVGARCALARRSLSRARG